MLYLLLVCLAAAGLAQADHPSSVESLSATFASMNGLQSPKGMKRDPVITEATGEELVADHSRLPENFDWRNVNGQSFVTADINQHIPVYCGSCWIHGVVGALNDRLKIQRRAQFPEVMLSRQALVNCVPGSNNSTPPGCNGGDSWEIFKYMHKTPVPDETCMPYAGVNMQCNPFNVCRNCAPGVIMQPDGSIKIKGATCFSIPSWTGYRIGDHGVITGEVAMMKEIYARGPISCNMNAALDGLQFVFNYSTNPGVIRDNVFTTDTPSNDSDHVMGVTGWGVSHLGTKYWAMRNSWGTYWADEGWVKLRRGVNQMMVESQCYWGVVEFDELDQELKGQVLGDYYSGVHWKPRSIDLSIPEQPNAMRENSGLDSWTWATICSAMAASASLGSFLTYKVLVGRVRSFQPNLLG